MDPTIHNSWSDDHNSNLSVNMNLRSNGNKSGNTATAPIAPTNNHCITADHIEDLLARIVHRVDLKESHEGDGSTAERWSNNGKGNNNQNKEGGYTNGPLTSRELSDLSFLCSEISAAQSSATRGQSDNSSNFSFANVDVDSVLSVMELLDRHVNLAVSTNLIESAACILADSMKSPSQIASALEQWATNGEGQNLVSILRNGLEAAAIVLFIVNTPNIDRRVLSEDAIKGVITLMRLNLSRHLLPALNQVGHYLSEVSSKKDPQESPASKRRRVSSVSDGTFINGKDLKNIYKRIVATVDLQLKLMERVEGVVRLIPLDDQQVLMVTSGVLPTFEIDINAASMSYSHDVFQAQQLQTTSITILTAAFRKYPMHREIILEDLFPVMLNLNTSKRSLRTFPIRYSSSSSTILQAKNADIVGSLLFNGIVPHYIQMITALVLSLVHSCVLRPYFTGNGSSNADDGIENAAKGESVQSGLRSCSVVADTFVRFLLKKCTKSKGDSMSDYRPVLINLIEDLLMVLIVPEYPAAEILLAAFQRRLNQDLTLSSPLFCASTNQQIQSSPDITYLNCAVDVVGKICSVQARLLGYTEANPIRLVSDAPTSHAYSSEQDMDCYCRSQHTDVLRIQCDQCNSIFHGPCVGVPDNESTPDEWYCDCCSLGRIVKREQQRLNVPDMDTAIFDQAYAMRYMFQSMLSQQMRSIDDKMVDQVKIHLARWIDEIEGKRNSIKSDTEERHPARLILSKLFEYWDTNYGPNAESLSDEGIVRVTISLMTQTSPFILPFRKQVELHLKHMSDDNPQILRKLSLKVIEKCIEGDQTLMLLPIIKKAVSKRLSDESISVREAAVSLVGNYIARSPVAIRTYHSVLLPCLTDPGVSVRKRAVKIFQSILIKNPYYQGRTEVFCILVNRSIDPKEEESVRDLIDEVLYNLWFLSGTIPMSQHRPSAIELHSPIVSIPGVVTPNTPIPPVRRSSVQSRSDVTAEQMMEVVQIGNSYNSLESVLVKLLKGESCSLDNSGRKISEPMKGFELDGKECCRIVDSLCELLVVIDEQRDIRPHVGRDVSSTLKTLAMFSSISPTSVMKHFDAIIPYLKADNGVSMDDESAIVCALCDILYRLAPSFDQHIINGKASVSIAMDLTKISYKFGPAVIVSAIRAFSALANQSSIKGPSIFADKLLALSKTFYGYALKKNDIDDFTSINGQLKNSVHRALMVLGVVCEYRAIVVEHSTWDDDEEIEVQVPLLEDEISWETYTKACYMLFKNYLCKNDSATKCRALAALKGIFVAHPQLLLRLDHVGLFDDIMSDSAGEALQLEALDCWRNILEAEERRIDSGQADEKMQSNGKVTLSKQISGDQNGDATLFGGVLTNHSQRLFEMTKDTRATIRLSTLKLLGLLLRQGLLNPNEVIPHLFALQGDTGNETIRNFALQLLIIEGEKRPDILRQRICVGVKEAYNFQRAVYPDQVKVSAIVVNKIKDQTLVECIFGSVFENCISKNRKQRLGLYRSLLGLFETDQVDGILSQSVSKAKDLSLLSFAAQILAHLPYNTVSDPLFIIYQMTSIIVIQGQLISDHLTELLRQSHVFNGDELDDGAENEDVFEKAAKSKFPSRTQEARALSSKNFDLKKFVSLVNEGTAVSLLLRLKTFLCKIYNLSLTRCLEYDPNEKERLCKKGASNMKCTEVFDATIAKVQGTIDKDLVLRQYAEFRNLMRLENSLQARSSAVDEDILGKGVEVS